MPSTDVLVRDMRVDCAEALAHMLITAWRNRLEKRPLTMQAAARAALGPTVASFGRSPVFPPSSARVSGLPPIRR